MIIGYMRTYNINSNSLAVQHEVIKRYCYEHDVKPDQFICDERSINTRLRAVARELSKIGYNERYRGESSFPQFDQLLILMATGQVEAILVDVRMRLNVNSKLDDFFDNLCKIHNVDVIEVGDYPPDNEPTAVCVAVYHDTDKSKIRPVYCISDFDEMYSAVVHPFGWTVGLSSVDVCRFKGGREKFKVIIENLAKFDVLLVRAMFNIDLWTGKFMQYLYELQQNGVKLYTLSSGEIQLHNDECIMSKKLRIVAYDSFSHNQEKAELLKSIMEAFVNHKTNWSLCNYYYEGHRIHVDENQRILEEIVAEQDNWDGLLVKSFARVNERTTRFEKILHRIDKDKFIYSIEEGVYLYGKKEKSLVL